MQISMKIVIAQINTTVGDINGNTASILQRIEAAKRDHADMIVLDLNKPLLTPICNPVSHPVYTARD